MTTVIANGNVYSDAGESAKDMRNGGHRLYLLPMVSDVMVEVGAAKTARDAAAVSAAAAASFVGAFAPAAQAVPNMTVQIAAGDIYDGGALIEKATQTSAVIVKPAVNPRIDRIVGDVLTGVISLVGGVEAVGPTAPAIPVGKFPICRVTLTPGMAAITTAMITDERARDGGSVQRSGGDMGGPLAVQPATLAAHPVTAAQVQAQSVTAFTSTGAAPVFVLTPMPAITAYAANQRFRCKFHAAGTTGSCTLNISGLGAKSLKQYDATGAKVAAAVAGGQLADVEYDGTDFVILDPLPVVVLDTNGRIPRQQTYQSPTVRQSVLSGWVNAGGRPDFLLIGGGLSVDVRANPATAQLVIAFGGGFDQYGQVDHIGIATANVNIPGLTANATNYLYADYNPVTRAVTFGATPSAPVYQPNIQLTPGVTTIIPDAVVAYFYGGPAQQVLRVFIGEAVTGASAVASVTCYAFGARATLTGIAMSASSVQAFTHNMGMNIPPAVRLSLKCVVANSGYEVGEELNRWVDGYTGIADSSIACVSDRLVTRVVTGQQANIAVPNKSTGVMSASALSNWAPIVRADRGW